jgi:hypothetical protein
MTTTVIIQAHCASTKEVVVELVNDDYPEMPYEVFSLQDGETAQRVVYDNRQITVREVPKESAPAD